MERKILIKDIETLTDLSFCVHVQIDRLNKEIKFIKDNIDDMERNGAATEQAYNMLKSRKEELERLQDFYDNGLYGLE